MAFRVGRYLKDVQNFFRILDPPSPLRPPFMQPISTVHPISHFSDPLSADVLSPLGVIANFFGGLLQEGAIQSRLPDVLPAALPRENEDINACVPLSVQNKRWPAGPRHSQLTLKTRGFITAR